MFCNVFAVIFPCNSAEFHKNNGNMYTVLDHMKLCCSDCITPCPLVCHKELYTIFVYFWNVTLASFISMSSALSKYFTISIIITVMVSNENGALVVLTFILLHVSGKTAADVKEVIGLEC